MVSTHHHPRRDDDFAATRLPQREPTPRSTRMGIATATTSKTNKTTKLTASAGFGGARPAHRRLPRTATVNLTLNVSSRPTCDRTATISRSDRALGARGHTVTSSTASSRIRLHMARRRHRGSSFPRRGPSYSGLHPTQRGHPCPGRTRTRPTAIRGVRSTGRGRRAGAYLRHTMRCCATGWRLC